MQCNIRLRIFCRWGYGLSMSSSSRACSVNLPRTSFPLTMKGNVAEKEVAIQRVTSNTACIYCSWRCERSAPWLEWFTSFVGLLYCTVKLCMTPNTLQSDLDSVQEWEKDWLMEFNPSKCEAVTFIRKTRPVKAKYNLHGTTLETVTSTKYLGVHISSKLTWNEHTDITTKKASQILKFVRRNFWSCPTHIREQCYKTTPWFVLG